MTSQPASASPAIPDLPGVRPAVQAVPAYPFTPIDAPIKLDQNESAYDFPAELKALAADRMVGQLWNRYPDLHAEGLRARVAAFEDWDEAGVVITPGSNVLIKILTELGGIGQTVLTVRPTFSVYTLEAQLLGANLVEVPLNTDFSLPVEGLKAALRANPPACCTSPSPTRQRAFWTPKPPYVKLWRLPTAGWWCWTRRTTSTAARITATSCARARTA